MVDISSTIIAKSDQLNADDLIGGSITVTITNVSLTESPDQPLTINYDGDNGRPYKPCKSMRRVLAAAWGNDGSKFIGRRVTLFRDPRVKWAGQEVGGVRISHMSDLPKPVINLSLQVTRGKKAPYEIRRLDSVNQDEKTKAEPANYPDDLFNENFPRMEAAIKTGKSTPSEVINHLKKTAEPTKQQIEKLQAITPDSINEDEEVF